MMDQISFAIRRQLLAEWEIARIDSATLVDDATV